MSPDSVFAQGVKPSLLPKQIPRPPGRPGRLIDSNLIFNRADTLRGALSPYRTCFDVQHYGLHLRLVPEQKSIAGYTDITFKATDDFSIMQLDLYANLIIDSILMYSPAPLTVKAGPGAKKTVAGAKAPAMQAPAPKGNAVYYTRELNAVFVHSPVKLLAGSSNMARVYYHGNPMLAAKPPWDGGFVFATDSSSNELKPWIGVSCEDVGASIWFPCKDHLSDEPDRGATISTEVPTGLMCVSNGNLAETTKLPDGYTRFTWQVTYPINTYNITLNVADYVHFSEVYRGPKPGTARVAELRKNANTGAKITEYSLDYYVLRKNKEIAQKHFKQVKPMLRCYEDLFGPYPYAKDGYALVQTPYWGMEHQGAIAYGNNFKNRTQGFDFIIIHESGHEYWGNNVSVSDPADMWIHEGFCTYSETLYLECLKGKDSALAYLEMQRGYIKNKKPLLAPRNVAFHKRTDNDIYYKGAWMLHTLRSVMNNDPEFFSLLKRIQQHFGGKQTSTDSLVAFINVETKTDFNSFFRQYLHYKEPPVLLFLEKDDNIMYEWAADAPGFNMPVDIRIGDGPLQRIYPETGKFKILTLSKQQNVSTPVTVDTTRFLVKQLRRKSPPMTEE
ncbi:MAG: M1 family metallopeptidase [Bacteroidota bacterium]